MSMRPRKGLGVPLSTISQIELVAKRPLNHFTIGHLMDRFNPKKRAEAGAVSPIGIPTRKEVDRICQFDRIRRNSFNCSKCGIQAIES